MRPASFCTFTLAILATFAAMLCPAGAQPPRRQPMRKASELIRAIEKPRISAKLYAVAAPENTHVIVSLSEQRARLFVNGEAVPAIDTPISSGKRVGMTPTGSFKIVEKDPDHRSNLYGDFVDAKGRVVRGGVSSRIDSAPSGTRFAGAPMRWFMRFAGPVGMHVGILPGYPASHGCVRLPAEIAPLIYKKVKIGTPVEVVP